MNLSDINPLANSQSMNRLMQSRFGFKLDYTKLTYEKAQQLKQLVDENIARIRRSYGAHTAERNPKYMELLMINESLAHWMQENRWLMESEMGKSQAILAAKDMVDSIQDMVEKVSRMQVEQLPALIDTIRDQIGMSQAETFKTSMGDLLTQVSQSLGQARETADSNARALAGEDMGDEISSIEPVSNLKEPSDLDMDTDEFGGTDAAAGGTEPLGREKRQ